MTYDRLGKRGTIWRPDARPLCWALLRKKQLLCVPLSRKLVANSDETPRKATLVGKASDGLGGAHCQSGLDIIHQFQVCEADLATKQVDYSAGPLGVLVLEGGAGTVV